MWVAQEGLQGQATPATSLRTTRRKGVTERIFWAEKTGLVKARKCDPVGVRKSHMDEV